MIKLFKQMLKEPGFLKNAWVIILPATIQALLTMITNVVDTIMIGRLGEVSIGAVGLASKVFFVFILFIFGLGSGTGVLVAQYWGNKDTDNIRNVTGLSLVLAVAISSLIAAVCAAFPESVMRILTNSPLLIKEGAKYLRIVALSFPFTAITCVYGNSLKSMGVIRPQTYISIGAIVTNIVFNWILIFGKLGVPALGVEGAAIATFIARSVEVILTVILIRKSNTVICCSPKKLMGFDKPLVKQFISVAMPVILNEILWSMGQTAFAVVYGHMGEQPAAVITIMSAYMDIDFVGLTGLSLATSVMLGNELGAGHIDTADRYGKYFLLLSQCVAVFLVLLTIGIAKPFTMLYDISEEVAASVIMCMIFYAASMFSRCANNIIIVGILRSGGDSRGAAIIDLSTLWLVAVPFAAISGLVWGWADYMVYIFVCLDEVIKSVLALIRYSRKKWLKNLAVELTQAQAKC